MAGAFDCSVLGVLRDAEADSTARARMEGELFTALEHAAGGVLRTNT